MAHLPYSFGAFELIPPFLSRPCLQDLKRKIHCNRDFFKFARPSDARYPKRLALACGAALCSPWLTWRKLFSADVRGKRKHFCCCWLTLRNFFSLFDGVFLRRRRRRRRCRRKWRRMITWCTDAVGVCHWNCVEETEQKSEKSGGQG